MNITSFERETDGRTRGHNKMREDKHEEARMNGERAEDWKRSKKEKRIRERRKRRRRKRRKKGRKT